jgi:filamentous hemagglutinin family protein
LIKFDGAEDPTLIKFDGTMGPKGELMPNTEGDFDISDTYGSYDHPDSSKATNLFHSFEIFELRRGDTATFTADATPTYVIVRVSGGGGTVVNGTLASRVENETGSGADIIWIDPHGIKFGEQAKLDVPGSAHFGSAHNLIFEDGTLLDAIPASLDRVSLTLLTSAAPSHFGFSNAELNLVGVYRSVGLGVPEGEIFQLVGGDGATTQGGVEITSHSSIRGGRNPENILAPGASVQLASAAGPAEIPLDLRGFDPNSELLGAVFIDNLVLIDVSSASNAILGEFGAVGQVVIRGGQFRLSSGAALRAVNHSDASALNPSIDIAVSGPVDIFGGSILNSTQIHAESDEGRAGNIQITADTITIHDQGTRVQSFARSEDDAVAGPALDFFAREVIISDGAFVRSVNLGSGPGGEIKIGADQRVEVSADSQISSFATLASSGAVGTILIAADDSIEISGAGSRVESILSGTGAGTVIKMEAATIEVTDGAQVVSATSGPEAGSDIDLRANTVRVIGAVEGTFPPIRSAVFAGANESATKEGGSIAIAAEVVEVLDGALVTSETLGKADAGGVSIRGLEDADGSRAQIVRIAGGPNGFSAISSSTGSAVPNLDDSGKGGDLTIAAERLELLNGGLVTVSTVGLGDAGSIGIDAGVVEISGVIEILGADGMVGESEAGIFARSNNSVDKDPPAGSAGDIVIEVDEQLRISDRGRISVSTRGTGGAGSILINAGGSVVVSEGASIEAELEVVSATGSAGEITIVAGDSVSLTGGSLITARSGGSADAGAITIVAGRSFEAIESEVTTAADFASGGQILITASELVYLLDSVISTDVADGDGGGGDVMIGDPENVVPDFVVLNESGIGASARDGSGGRIDIATGTFFASAPFAINPGRPFPTTGSFLDATSDIPSLTGTVNVDPPETELVTELASLPASFLDASALLGTACEARTSRAGSFQVQRYAAFVSPPDANLSAIRLSQQVPGGGSSAIALPRCLAQKETP